MALGSVRSTSEAARAGETWRQREKRKAGREDVHDLFRQELDRIHAIQTSGKARQVALQKAIATAKKRRTAKLAEARAACKARELAAREQAKAEAQTERERVKLERQAARRRRREECMLRAQAVRDDAGAAIAALRIVQRNERAGVRSKVRAEKNITKRRPKDKDGRRPSVREAMAYADAERDAAERNVEAALGTLAGRFFRATADRYPYSMDSETITEEFTESWEAGGEAEAIAWAEESAQTDAARRDEHDREIASSYARILADYVAKECGPRCSKATREQLEREAEAAAGECEHAPDFGQCMADGLAAQAVPF